MANVLRLRRLINKKEPTANGYWRYSQMVAYACIHLLLIISWTSISTKQFSPSTSTTSSPDSKLLRHSDIKAISLLSRLFARQKSVCRFILTIARFQNRWSLHIPPPRLNDQPLNS